MARVAKAAFSPISMIIGDKATSALLAIAAFVPGPQQPFVAAAAAAFTTLSQLTAPKPVAKGSPAQLTIDVEPPRTQAVGVVMVGGTLRHDVAYGPTLKKVPNPYRWQVRVLSGVGPINGFLGDYFDFEPIGSYYSSGFLNIVRQNGNRPEASALLPAIPGASGAPGWNSTSKLSGCAAVGLNLLFDKDGERYASGIPIYTALLEGEKVYDPRLDSTFPGGSGPCRAGVESTYVYNRNPACRAVTYALGHFQNGTRIFGLGQPADTIDMPAIVDWANDCDANGWTVNMILTEGGTGANLREQRVRNLDDVCAAGGARWYQAGGLLSFDWHRPRIALATLTDDDILEAGGGTDAVQTVRNRMNGVRPQYVSPEHNWQQITAAEIVGSTYRTEDGSPLTQVYPLNGVTNAEQAGELAAYWMTDSREIGPMDIQAKAKWRFYRPGDCIQIDSSLVAYQGQAVINQRGLNPQSLAVPLSLKSETPGKHDFALGKVANPPPTPVLAQTPEERDLLAAAALAPRGVDLVYDDGTPIEDLKPAEPGSDVTAAVSGPGELVLNYNSDDTLASILPVTGSYSLTRAGGSAFTSGVNWAVTVLSGTFSGAAPTIVGSGSAQLRLNSGLSTNEATLRITASLDGRAYPPFAVKVSKVVAPPTSSGGTGSGNNFASDNTLNSFSSGSFVAISNDLTITLPSGVTQATLTASSLELRVPAEAPIGPTNSEFKWQRETSPGVWADIGAVAPSSPSPETDAESFPGFVASLPGSVTCNRTTTGLAAGSTQKFRLVGRYVSGQLRSTSVLGTVSAQG